MKENKTDKSGYFECPNCFVLFVLEGQDPNLPSQHGKKVCSQCLNNPTTSAEERLQRIMSHFENTLAMRFGEIFKLFYNVMRDERNQDNF